jgi:hypothetical protein
MKLFRSRLFTAGVAATVAAVLAGGAAWIQSGPADANVSADSAAFVRYSARAYTQFPAEGSDNQVLVLRPPVVRPYTCVLTATSAFVTSQLAVGMSGVQFSLEQRPWKTRGKWFRHDARSVIGTGVAGEQATPTIVGMVWDVLDPVEIGIHVNQLRTRAGDRVTDASGSFFIAATCAAQ